jgi:hypothetical protein
MGKKIGQKILPKDGKRMRPVRIFGILAVRELPFLLRYHSFGSLMPGQTCTDTLLISNSHTHFSPSQSHSLSRVNSHPHIHTFSPAHVHSFYLFLTHIFSDNLSLSLSLTYTHTHTHTHNTHFLSLSDPSMLEGNLANGSDSLPIRFFFSIVFTTFSFMKR